MNYSRSLNLTWRYRIRRSKRNVKYLREHYVQFMIDRRTPNEMKWNEKIVPSFISNHLRLPVYVHITTSDYFKLYCCLQDQYWALKMIGSWRTPTNIILNSLQLIEIRLNLLNFVRKRDLLFLYKIWILSAEELGNNSAVLLFILNS